MPRFFVRSDQIENGTVTVTGDDARHLSRSLRMAVGEIITVCDMKKNEYECELTEFLPDCVRAKIIGSKKSETEPPFRAHVYQALPKGDKLDSIIQKAVECGANSITTFESERCIVRIKGENEEKKLDRRQRIALEAAKQCGRGCIPSVYPTKSFSKVIAEAAEADIPLFCYEGTDTVPMALVLKQMLVKSPNLRTSEPRISIVVGSEGGFSKAEAEAAVAAGMIPVGLGNRILRTETAASFVLSCLVYELELS